MTATPYQTLKTMHNKRDLFLLPNAWDVPTAKAFDDAGFPLIGTSSWAVAVALGYADGEKTPFDLMLHMISRIAASTKAMITADLEAGYAADEATLKDNIARVLKAGAVGMNLEDSLKGDTSGLRDADEQAARIRAIKSVTGEHGEPIFLNARTDTFLGSTDKAASLREAVRRAEVYAAAGADCLFVPFLTDHSVIADLVKASPLPVNVMVRGDTANLAKLREIGVARASLGTAMFENANRHYQTTAKALYGSDDISALFA